jgi:hypothetical protein
MLTALLLALLLVGTAQAGEHSYSVACKGLYKSSVVKGESFQDYCLTPVKPKEFKPTPVTCMTYRFLPLEFQKNLGSIRKACSSAALVEVRVPENLKALVSYFMKGIQNVEIQSRPSGFGNYIEITLCREVKR